VLHSAPGPRSIFEIIGAIYSVCPTDVLGRVMDGHLRRVGAPGGRRKRPRSPEKLRTRWWDDIFPHFKRARDPEISRHGQKYSSTDSGDVSWVTPLATLNTRKPGCRERLRIPGRRRQPRHGHQAIKAAVVAARRSR